MRLDVYVEIISSMDKEDRELERVADNETQPII